MVTQIISKKRQLLQEFSKLEERLQMQLEGRYSVKLIRRIFSYARKEFEQMIPDLPPNVSNTKVENPYIRLLFFSAMSMAIYYGLNFYLKDKKVAKRILVKFIQFNLPVGISIPGKVLVYWMFRRFGK